MHDGIAAAGLNINETAFGWINDNYSNYPKADITMDDPSTATYYIGEIPFSAYSGEAQASIAGTTALVVIGRGGGEGGDLSRDLLGDLNSGVSKNFTPNDETSNYEEGQHELELTVEEKSVIAAAKASCDKTIVIVNASTPMELGPLMSGEYEADAHPVRGLPGCHRLHRRGQAADRRVQSLRPHHRHLARRLHRRPDLRQLWRQALHRRLRLLREELQQRRLRGHRVLRGVQGRRLHGLPLLRDRGGRGRGWQLRRL